MRCSASDAGDRGPTRHPGVYPPHHRPDDAQALRRDWPAGRSACARDHQFAGALSLLEGGVYDALPNLKVVVTTLAIGGVLLAGGFGEGQRIRRDTPSDKRRHVYIDTMGLHPALVSSVVELLGADHVIAGTDWPIVVEKDVPARLQRALAVAGLSAEQQQMVAAGNTLKLLGVA